LKWRQTPCLAAASMMLYTTKKRGVKKLRLQLP
jgi:hypothetical protein